ncbi:MAG: formylglycine-generating enzyme family protein [Pirellulaceae bacterium]
MIWSMITKWIGAAFLLTSSIGLVVAQEPEKITNCIGMSLVRIPGGKFTMGSPVTEAGRDSDERLQEVSIPKGFYLGAFEVTQGEYRRLTGNNPSYFNSASPFDQSTALPVERVTWEEAAQFCRRLSEIPEERSAGRVYRLPTEAEWEYACRAGSPTAFCFGDDANQLSEFAWYAANSKGVTHPVGSKTPNDWGLYDMHGNVWEWCSDWYSEYPKGDKASSAIKHPRTDRVLRGGGWGLGAAFCRSAYRAGAGPNGRGLNAGFRVAMDILPTR